jgi:nitrite reductase/ring-hydroxylating ferredoxin subunit
VSDPRPPLPPATGDARFEDVASLSAVPNPGMLPAALSDGTRVVLVRRGDLVSALLDECTHQAMPLSAGELYADGTIECPWHGARFDGVTGACRRGPAEDDVARFDVRVEAGRVWCARAPTRS